MGSEKTTWRIELSAAFAETGDANMVTTMTDDDLDRRFNPGFGTSEGCSFTAWGDKYVYFPVVYDGSESVGWAPRDPCDEATRHWGCQ